MTISPQRHKGTKVGQAEESFMPSCLCGEKSWDCTRDIIGAAIEVHRELGPGLLERVYEEALVVERESRGLGFDRQVVLPVVYKGRQLDCDCKLDLVVEQSVIIELKAVESLLPVHEAQLLTYLKITGLNLGLLINFNVAVLKQGIKRLVNGTPPSRLSSPQRHEGTKE